MSTATKTEYQVIEIPLFEIYDDEQFNCRGRVIPLDVLDLARNIQEQGLIQPVIVQPFNEGPAGTKYRLVAGYRRFAAHKVNKADTILCIVRDDIKNDADARIINLCESLNRKDLTIGQEAKAVNELLKKGMVQQAIADKLHVSRGWVQNRIYYLKLPKSIQDDADAGWLNAEHLHAMHNLPQDQQYEFAKEVKNRKQAEGGTRVRVKVSKKALQRNKYDRMIRDKTQINKMMDHIFDSVGGNFGTRCLAWANGNISSAELFQDVKEIAEEQGKRYLTPDKDL